MNQRARTRSFVWAGVAFGIAVLIVGAIYFVIRINSITLAIRDNQDAIRNTQKHGVDMLNELEVAAAESHRSAVNSQRTQEQIKDCIDPHGKCFKMAQQQTASAVGSINEITYYAVSCADEPGTQTLDEIRACVLGKLTAARRTPTADFIFPASPCRPSAGNWNGNRKGRICMVNLRYRHVNELYVTGIVHVLKDGTPIWLQVLSPFEQQVARDEAATARARRVLALRENGSDRQIQIRAAFFEDGTIGAIEPARRRQVHQGITKSIDELRADPDWKERLDVLARGATDPSTPLTEQELQLLDNLEADYIAEIRRRHDDEREFLRLSYMDADEDTLWQEYLEHWLDQQGGDVALTEFQLCRILFGARVCNGIKTDDNWDHAPCERPPGACLHRLARKSSTFPNSC